MLSISPLGQTDLISLLLFDDVISFHLYILSVISLGLCLSVCICDCMAGFFCFKFYKIKKKISHSANLCKNGNNYKSFTN